MASVHKITPSNPRLSALLTDVEKGNIKIPVFQRKFVWEDEQIMSLLDSIYQGYPVGSLLLWSTKSSLKYERNVGGFALPKTPEDFPVNYILDGQQRLTTLYGVFNSDAATQDPELAARFDVSFLPDGEEFVHSQSTNGAAAINLRKILDTTKLLPELERFDDEQRRRIATLTERFKDYEFPVVTIKERTNQEVCRVFQRINSSGTSLSTVELLAAWTWSDKFDLRRELEILLDTLSDKGYDQLDQTLLMRCLAAITLGVIDVDALVDEPADNLVAAMSKLKEAIFSTVDFLEKQLKIKNIVFLPFPIMIVPLVYFYSKKSKPTAEQLRGLRRWFWHCAFTQKYKAGTNKNVLADLARMDELVDERHNFDHLASSIDRSLFQKTWRINSTAAKAAICLLAQAAPRSFLTGHEVDLGSALSAYNAREFHHIYPKGYLATKGITFHEANVIANVCFLTSSDNRAISDKAPVDYFKDVPNTDREAIFDSAFISGDCREGTMLYADFLSTRAEKLALAAEKLIQDGSLK